LVGLDLNPPPRFRVVLGPQHDHFSDNAIAAFFAGEYTISAGSDRMGMRLAGPCLEHVKHYSITSDGIAPGSIQVTGTGQPIVLLADRHTIGGYAKIATVITADLPALARLPIGAKVAFEPVAMDVAVAARRELLAQLASFDEQVMPIIRADVDIAPRLLDCNLISGFVDGRGSIL
jgi:allophanate hydrolase subunit 2